MRINLDLTSLHRVETEARVAPPPKSTQTDRIMAPDVLPRRIYQKKTPQAQARDTFRKLAKSVLPGEWTSIDGLYSGLDALLKATQRSTTQSAYGARSLFEMCLRKVPSYILEEQASIDGATDLEYDVGAEIYEDLESFGSTTGAGWRPLREVARAHGIAVLADGINDSSITAEVARGLIVLCLQLVAFDEARILCTSLVNTLVPLSRPQSLGSHLFGHEASLQLQTLHDVALRSGHWGFLFRQLSRLLESGYIPVEWLATVDMVECWNNVTRSIAREDEYSADSSHLLEVSISLGYRGIDLDPGTEIERLRLVQCRFPRLQIMDSLPSVVLPAPMSADDANLGTRRKISTALTNVLADLVTFLFTVASSWLQSGNQKESSNLGFQEPDGGGTRSAPGPGTVRDHGNTSSC